MADDYGFGGKRNKKRDKAKKKRENPYKSGGRFRSSSISDTDNASKKVTNLKKAKNKKKIKKKK
jgi:hypothetical protein